MCEGKGGRERKRKKVGRERKVGERVRGNGSAG
jgi:hypothetical protein